MSKASHNVNSLVLNMCASFAMSGLIMTLVEGSLPRQSLVTGVFSRLKVDYLTKVE